MLHVVEHNLCPEDPPGWKLFVQRSEGISVENRASVGVTPAKWLAGRLRPMFDIILIGFVNTLE